MNEMLIPSENVDFAKLPIKVRETLLPLEKGMYRFPCGDCAMGNIYISMAQDESGEDLGGRMVYREDRCHRHVTGPAGGAWVRGIEVPLHFPARFEEFEMVLDHTWMPNGEWLYWKVFHREMCLAYSQITEWDSDSQKED